MSEHVKSVICSMVTRGDLEEGVIDAILHALVGSEWFDDKGGIVPWRNNRAAFDAKVFGRFLVAAPWRNDPGYLVYTQDDDCTVAGWGGLVDAWEPGKIACNMPQDFQDAYRAKRSRLLGFGAVFEINLIRPTFDRYFKYFPQVDDLFLNECDRIFTGLNTERCIMVDVGHVDMPYASDASRMWKQPDHGQRMVDVSQRIEYVLEQEAAGQ